MNRNILTLAVLGCAQYAVAQNTEKPNFALFIADDCSYYDLGCYGSKDSMTPNIDNFAKEGMMFSKAYQAVPMSSPTRHNLYTGIWPVRSGAYPNHTFVDINTKSIVHQLKPLGYKVALIGKSHISPKKVFPFDLFVPSDKSGDLDFDAISKFIEDCKNENVPFCLLVASNQPHTPWNKGDASKFKQEELSLPPIYVDIPETRQEFSAYLAEINYMDNEFGTLLDIIDRQEVRENTMVVYLSEQGNSLPFAKWTCYDAGVHSGCIVRWPGKIKPGSKNDAIVEYVDILPTFVDIAGGEPVEKMDGESFKEVLLGRRKTHKKYTFSMQTTRGINKGSDYYG
ncbi:MAG: sulfatase, partial [Candidatus Cryptobacteroides sp.]